MCFRLLDVHTLADQSRPCAEPACPQTPAPFKTLPCEVRGRISACTKPACSRGLRIVTAVNVPAYKGADRRKSAPRHACMAPVGSGAGGPAGLLRLKNLRVYARAPAHTRFLYPWRFPGQQQKRPLHRGPRVTHSQAFSVPGGVDNVPMSAQSASSGNNADAAGRIRRT